MVGRFLPFHRPSPDRSGQAMAASFLSSLALAGASSNATVKGLRCWREMPPRTPVDNHRSSGRRRRRRISGSKLGTIAKMPVLSKRTSLKFFLN